MDVFERDGYRLRFVETVGGKEQRFEFFWEPDESVEGLLRAWKEGDERRRFNAVYLMSQKEDERFLDVLLEAAQMRSFVGRGIATVGLARYLRKSRAARKVVFSALKSGDMILTAAALQALGRLNSWRSRRALRRVLRHLRRRPDIQGGTGASTPAALLLLAAVESLLLLGENGDTVAASEAMINHTDRAVRIQTLSVATRFPQVLSASSLERFLSAPVPECIMAAETLVKKGDTSRLTVLSEYAESPDTLTRTHTIAALARINNNSSLDLLERLLPSEKETSLRIQMAYHLKKAGRFPPLDSFSEALRAKSPLLRQSAITLLSRLPPNSEGVRDLLTRQREVEPDEFLRYQIDQVLKSGESGDLNKGGFVQI
ncbi:MAG: HEAT repeat domain-containing protein [Planctomycetota bacterium]|nr:HEAT repeat domain-containing protein [Planctomycetota bacterium]